MGGDLRIDLTLFTPRRIVEAWFVEAAWNVPPAKVISEERKLQRKAPRDCPWLEIILA
jgi:hypothetical protein